MLRQVPLTHSAHLPSAFLRLEARPARRGSRGRLQRGLRAAGLCVRGRRGAAEKAPDRACGARSEQDPAPRGHTCGEAGRPLPPVRLGHGPHWPISCPALVCPPPRPSSHGPRLATSCPGPGVATPPTGPSTMSLAFLSLAPTTFSASLSWDGVCCQGGGHPWGSCSLCWNPASWAWPAHTCLSSPCASAWLLGAESPAQPPSGCKSVSLASPGCQEAMAGQRRGPYLPTPLQHLGMCPSPASAGPCRGHLVSLGFSLAPPGSTGLSLNKNTSQMSPGSQTAGWRDMDNLRMPLLRSSWGHETESPGSGAVAGVHVGWGQPRYLDSRPHHGRHVRTHAGQVRSGREYVLAEGAAASLEDQEHAGTELAGLGIPPAAAQGVLSDRGPRAGGHRER